MLCLSKELFVLEVDLVNDHRACPVSFCDCERRQQPSSLLSEHLEVY